MKRGVTGKFPVFNMVLSIIIVSYNEIEYLSDAINSCIKDYFFDYEIIIGDDGSNDGSIELIKDFSIKYPGIIKYFVMERNDSDMIIPSIRVSKILKKAFSISTGEYIRVISGDDFLENKACENQVDFLKNNPRYDSCYTNYEKIWDSGEKISYLSIKPKLNSVFWATSYVHISCFLFRKKVLTYLLDNFCDDTGLLYSILATGKTKQIDVVGFAYRQRSYSIMHKSDRFELCLLEILLFQDIINKNILQKSSYSRFYKWICFYYNNFENINKRKYDKYTSLLINTNLSLNFDINRKKELKNLVRKSKFYYLIYKCIFIPNRCINIFRKIFRGKKYE